MTVATVEFADVARNDEGFFLDPVAVELRPWSRHSLRRKGSMTSPTGIGRSSVSCGVSTWRRGPDRPCACLGKASGVSIKELYELFPKGPAKVAARIAGIPKPRGCI